MYNILTVYGTDVDGTHYRGDQWWQVDSPFQKRVMSYLDTDNHRIEWNTVPWNSANSWKERQKGAKNLAKATERLIEDGSEKIVMIGHSHGGNIIQRVLMRWGSKKKPESQKRVLSGITIGTPFEHFTVKWSSFGFTFLIYLSVMMGMLWEVYFGQDQSSTELQKIDTAPAEDINTLSTPNWLELILDQAWAIVAVSIVMSVLMMYWAFKTGNRDIRNVAKSRTVLYSRIDEVINALVSIPEQRVTVATPSSVYAPTVAVLMIVSFMFHQVMSNYYEAYEIWITDFVYGAIPYAAEIDKFVPSKEITVLGCFLMISLIGSLVGARWGISWLVAKTFNSIFKSYGEQRAFGGDSLIAKVDFMDPRPLHTVSWLWSWPFFRRDRHEWRPLPYEFDQMASEGVDEAAAGAVRQARAALALSSVTKSHSLGEAIFGALNWKELIHTAYFEVEDFAKFIAWLLVEREGLPASPLYYEDVDGEKFQGWYDEISAALDED